MERRVNQTVIYQGLFLVALALFADQKNLVKSLQLNSQKVESAESESKKNLIGQLHVALKESPFFANPIDGVSLELKSNRVVISVDNDELYANEEPQISDEWSSFFDQLTLVLQSKMRSGNFEVRVVGYPDAGNALNRGTLSSAVERADHLIQKMKRSFATNPQIKLEASAGVTPSHGHRIDVEIESVNE